MILTYVKRFPVTETFLEFNLKLLFISGLWPGENLTQLQLTLYKIYENTLTIFMIIFLTLIGISNEHCTDLITFMSYNDVGIVSYNFFFKVIFFTLRRDQIKLLINDILISGDKVSDRARHTMIKLPIALFVLIFMIFIAFLLNGLVRKDLAIEAWMPFDPAKSNMNLFAATLILIVLYTIPFWFRMVSMECFVCSLIIYLCEQLKDLQKKIRGLKYTKVNEKHMRDEFKEIIRKHIRVVRYGNTMKTIFKEYFLIQYFCFTLELCINAVLIANVTRDQWVAVFSLILYLGIAILNGYIYASLGEDLISQSLDVAQAAYDSEWTSWPLDLQKTVLLIITVAQRPLQMTAGGYVPININTFGNALYNGYTVYAVLSDVVS